MKITIARSLFILLCLYSAPAAADFYENRLNAGAAAAAAGDLALAADAFRVAAFGLQDRPPLLVEALARLVLVQEELENPEEVDLALERFLEVEERSSVWQQVRMEPSRRADFLRLLRRELPPERFEQLKSFQPILAPGRETGAAEPNGDEETVEAEPLDRLDVEERIDAALQASREQILVRRYREAETILSRALELDPTNRQLRLGLLEAATLARHWSAGEEQIRVLEPITEAEGRYLFYAGVVKYEIGDLNAAREYMRRARERVNASPYVNDYLRRVLGE